MTSVNPLSVTRAPWHTLVAASVVLLVSASIGGAVGVVLDRYLLLPRQYNQRGPGPGRGGGWRGGPGPWIGDGGNRDGRGGGGPGRMGPGFGPGPGISLEMMSQLGLSDDQRSRVDSVLSHELAQFRALREQVDPKMDTLMRRTRARIDSILTPSQRTKLQDLQRNGDYWRGGGPGRRSRERGG